MRAADKPAAASEKQRIGMGSWAVLTILMALLAVTVFVAYLGWTLGKDAEVPTSAYVAMAFGVIVSLAVGFGLMALLFFSNRRGYDEPPILLVRKDSDDH
jgi:lipid-binding SYLF domain-containing protein